MGKIGVGENGSRGNGSRESRILRKNTLFGEDLSCVLFSFWVDMGDEILGIWELSDVFPGIGICIIFTFNTTPSERVYMFPGT